MEIPLKQNSQIIIMTIVVQKTLRKYEKRKMLISVRIKVQLPPRLPQNPRKIRWSEKRIEIRRYQVLATKLIILNQRKAGGQRNGKE